MNTLSWTIYFIGVLGGVGSLFAWMAGLGTVATIFITIWYLVIGFNSEDKEVKASIPFFKSLRNIVVPLFLIGWIGSIFIPDRRTMILIASSEVGGRVLESVSGSDLSKKSYELLNRWVSKELDSITGEAAPKKESSK
jgi:hypothetical protein